MLKHILSTSIALVLSSAAITANATDNDYTGRNNFSNFTTANDDGTAVPADNLQLPKTTPEHHFVPAKTQPASKLVPLSGEPASKLVPPKTVPASGFVPEKTQPAHNIQPQDSVPMTPMHHGKIPVYEGLGQGYRADIEVNLDKCQLDGNSPVPEGVSLDSLMISSRNGAKLTLDPNGNAQTVYHFSHEFHEFTSDMTEHSGISFIEVGPKTTRAVVKVNIDGAASTYQYNCSNSNVTFQPQ